MVQLSAYALSADFYLQLSKLCMMLQNPEIHGLLPYPESVIFLLPHYPTRDLCLAWPVKAGSHNLHYHLVLDKQNTNMAYLDPRQHADQACPWEPHTNCMGSTSRIFSSKKYDNVNILIIDLHSYSIHLITYVAYYYYNDVKGAVSSESIIDLNPRHNAVWHHAPWEPNKNLIINQYLNISDFLQLRESLIPITLSDQGPSFVGLLKQVIIILSTT